jgi:hypothetical protein
MIEAAVLDGRYSVRADFVGHSDERAVRVSATIRKLVIPPLLQAGFCCKEAGSWKRGVFLERTVGNVVHSLLPGVEKFGGSIGILAARVVGEKVDYFNWRGVVFALWEAELPNAD